MAAATPAKARASPGGQLNDTSSTRASPGRQLGDTSSVRASPGRQLSETSSPSAPSSPAKARWANTRGAQRRIASDAPVTPLRNGNAMANSPNPKAKEDLSSPGKMRAVSEEDSYYEEEIEEEERTIDEIVEPEEEIPAKQVKSANSVAQKPTPKPTPKPVVKQIPRQPTVDLGSVAAGAAHYGRSAAGKSGPRRAGIWKDGTVKEQMLQQQLIDQSAVEKKPKKGKKGGTTSEGQPLLEKPGILQPIDQDEMFEWGTLMSSPEQSDAETPPLNSSRRHSHDLRVQQRSQYHLLLTHERGGLAETAVEESFRPKLNNRAELNVGDHVIAVRGGDEFKAIVTDINAEGEIFVDWEDGIASQIKVLDIRDITVKTSQILAGDRLQARRADGTICNGLVRRVEDGCPIVDWFDGSGVNCRVEAKDIVKVFDIDEEDEDGEEDDTATRRLGEDADGNGVAEDGRSGGELEAVRKAKANRTRASVRIAKKVAEAISIIPMNQDLTWSEFSRSCYDRFGRIHVHECHCGGNYCGLSGLCRRCGKKRGHHLPRGGAEARSNCWTEDLYELSSPLLDNDMKLNHSQKQYALRAVAQRLKTPPWDWKGPGTALKSAVDAQCSELVYVMLQGGMNPDEADSRGVTSLHSASFLGRADICRLLLDGEANANVLDRHGQSPLFFAPNTQVCRLLAGFNADINLVNNNGQSALHFAARAGLRDVLQWFTERSSKSMIDLKDVYGVTAAQYMVLSCPEVADEALTPGSHCFTNPAMRPGRIIGHHRLPEPRWEIPARNSLRSGVRASEIEAKGPEGNLAGRKSEKPSGKMVVGR